MMLPIIFFIKFGGDEINIGKELIPIISTEFQGQTIQGVDARQLHEFLGSKQQFNNWIRRRIKRHDFVRNRDFIMTGSINPLGGRSKKDYTLTLDVAKQIAMVECTERGNKHIIILMRLLRVMRLFNPK